MSASRPQSILFVCMGNICRSPLAEGIARARLNQGLQLDSAGTIGYHSGSPPDPRAVRVAAQHGVDIAGLRARQVSSADFDDFELVLAMDQDNLAQLSKLSGAAAALEQGRLALMLDYCGIADVEQVPDPYYGGESGFVGVFDLLERACIGLQRRLRA